MDEGLLLLESTITSLFVEAQLYEMFISHQGTY